MDNKLPVWDETTEIQNEDALPSFEETKDIEKISPLETLARSTASSATFGFSDEMEAGLRAAWDAATSEDDFVDKYKQHVDKIRSREAAGEEQNPASAIAGTIGGMFVPGVGLAKLGKMGLGAVSKTASKLAQPNIMGSGIKGAVGRGAAQGGAYAAGTSESLESMPSDMVKGATIGGALGGVLEPIASRLFKPVAQRTIAAKAEKDAATGSLKAAGISSPQWEKLESMPSKSAGKNRLDSLGEKMVEEKIVTLSSRPADMFEKVKGKIEGLEQQMDDLAQQVPIKVKPFEIEQALIKTKEELKNKADIKRIGKISDEDINKVFDNIADDIKQYPRDLSVQDIRQIRKNIRDRINFEKAKMSGSDIILKDVGKVLTNKMKEMFSSAGLVGEFEKIDDSYSKLRDISKILSRSSAKQKSGVGMPGLMAGTAASIMGSAIGPAGIPVAFMVGLGGFELIRRYGKQALVSGNRTYAKQLNKIASGYDRLPQNAQSMIDAAAKRSPQAVIATSFLLQQSDPKYRKLMEED